jgi:hypothetical protein
MTQHRSFTFDLFSHLKESEVKDRIEASVVLGVLGNSCKGLGICRILPHNSAISQKCSTVSAEIIRISNHTIEINFNDTNLCGACQERFFGQAHFTVEEAFTLPQFVINKLQLDAKIIRKGHYKWKDSKKKDVIFNLSNNSQSVI